MVHDCNWYLDYNGNGRWDTGDKQYRFGLVGDIPVTGNWAGTTGTTSVESVDVNPVAKPAEFQVTSVTRPVAAVPVVEMPVRNYPGVSPVINNGNKGVPSVSNRWQAGAGDRFSRILNSNFFEFLSGGRQFFTWV